MQQEKVIWTAKALHRNQEFASQHTVLHNVCFANNLKPAIVLLIQRVTNKTVKKKGGESLNLAIEHCKLLFFLYIWSADKARVKVKTV